MNRSTPSTKQNSVFSPLKSGAVKMLIIRRSGRTAPSQGGTVQCRRFGSFLSRTNIRSTPSGCRIRKSRELIGTQADSVLWLSAARTSTPYANAPPANVAAHSARIGILIVNYLTSSTFFLARISSIVAPFAAIFVEDVSAWNFHVPYISFSWSTVLPETVFTYS